MIHQKGDFKKASKLSYPFSPLMEPLKGHEFHPKSVFGNFVLNILYLNEEFVEKLYLKLYSLCETLRFKELFHSCPVPLLEM